MHGGSDVGDEGRLGRPKRLGENTEERRRLVGVKAHVDEVMDDGPYVKEKTSGCLRKGRFFVGSGDVGTENELVGIVGVWSWGSMGRPVDGLGRMRPE